VGWGGGGGERGGGGGGGGGLGLGGGGGGGCFGWVFCLGTTGFWGGGAGVGKSYLLFLLKKFSSQIGTDSTRRPSTKEKERKSASRVRMGEEDY